MGLFDRIRGSIGDEADDGEPVDESAAEPGVDRGAGSRRVGVDDDGRKAGGHGSHWDAVVANNAEVREAVLEAVRTGQTRDGVDVGGETVTAHIHPPSGPIRTVAVSVGGEVVTAFPVGDGITHGIRLEGVTEWANDVEAQLEFSLQDNRMAAFATGYFFRGRDWYEVGTAYEMDLAGFAYDLGPPEESPVAEETDLEEGASGIAAFMQFDGGDVDDYVFRSTVEGVEEHSFGGRAVYRLRVPVVNHSDRDVEVGIFAAEHMIGDYVPAVGDEVEGVAWLQGRIV